MNAGASLAHHQLAVGPGEDLHYWTLGQAGRPVLLLLHGMRDVGRSLLPVAQALADRYYCVMPDLRGHGRSFKPGSYAMQHYLMDVRRLHQSLGCDSLSLLGHSLGGHIACRYAGLFGNSVQKLIVVEGLGPPPAPTPDSPLASVAAQLDAALLTAQHAHSPRPMASIEEAAQRLLANNPRLDPNWARQLAEWGTHPATGSPTSSGPRLWSFDPRAQEVFLGISAARSFDYWHAIKAHTLLVLGDLGHTYWEARFAADGYNGRFSETQLRERLEALGRADAPATCITIEDAGHQVHYDQPANLAEACRAFLNGSQPSAATS